MSPKKPYQKRLPTVLPPAPRRRPQQQAPPARAGRPPARTPGRTAPPTDPEVTAARPARASVPQPRNPEPARPTAQTDPARELTPAAVPPQDTASPVGAPARRGLATKGRWGVVVAAIALVGLLGVVVAVVVGVGVGRQVDEEDASVAPTSSFRIDGWPTAGVSRTVTEVRAGGHLDVTHWIHADRPMDELVLALPRLDDGEEVQVIDVAVVADGRPGGAPRPVDPVGASYSLDDATRIKVRYRLTGAVQRSPAGARRGVATTTALTVTPAQPRDIRVVRSQEVLSLACAEPDQQPVPCGESGGEDQWRVELDGTDAGSRVLAVVTVPS